MLDVCNSVPVLLPVSSKGSKGTILDECPWSFNRSTFLFTFKSDSVPSEHNHPRHLFSLIWRASRSQLALKTPFLHEGNLRGTHLETFTWLVLLYSLDIQVCATLASLISPITVFSAEKTGLNVSSKIHLKWLFIEIRLLDSWIIYEPVVREA